MQLDVSYTTGHWVAYLTALMHNLWSEATWLWNQSVWKLLVCANGWSECCPVAWLDSPKLPSSIWLDNSLEIAYILFGWITALLVRFLSMEKVKLMYFSACVIFSVMFRLVVTPWPHSGHMMTKGRGRASERGWLPPKDEDSRKWIDKSDITLALQCIFIHLYHACMLYQARENLLIRSLLNLQASNWVKMTCVC